MVVKQRKCQFKKIGGFYGGRVLAVNQNISGGIYGGRLLAVNQNISGGIYGGRLLAVNQNNDHVFSEKLVLKMRTATVL